MRRFHTCVCSTAHLPADERRFIKGLIADGRAGRSVIEHTDLTIVPHHDGYMVHVGVVEDHADRPDEIPKVLWHLLNLALEKGASWLSLDAEEMPLSYLPVYPDDPLIVVERPGVAIRCRACGSHDVMRDAWAHWDEAAQAWTLGAVFDQAFCNTCEADATLTETALAAPALDRAA